MILAGIPTGWYVCIMTSRGSSNSARDKLLDAAVTLIRRNGFAATSVDQLCAAAGVTKGAFFHHFVSKEALGVAAAGHWLAITTPLFADADYHREPAALARVLGYLDLREALIDGGTDASPVWLARSRRRCINHTPRLRALLRRQSSAMRARSKATLPKRWLIMALPTSMQRASRSTFKWCSKAVSSSPRQLVIRKRRARASGI